MTIASEKFERQIKRIHDLLEQSGSEVTWDDHLPDPDNPEQPRQIDVTIRRDNKLTMIECRIHKEKQDVKWIEELIGRRESLRADAVIAVSASGFTKGAIKKAHAYGIILRDMLSLTEEEIRRWGHKTKVKLTFYKFASIELLFVFYSKDKGKLTTNNIRKYLQAEPNTILQILEVVATTFEKKKIEKQTGPFKVRFSIEDLQIAGSYVKEICIRGRFQPIEQQLNTPSIVVYDAPDVGALERNVFIEIVELGNFEIIHTKDKPFAPAMDLSPIKPPPNCLFREVLFEFPPLLMDKIAFQIIAPPNSTKTPFDIKLSVAFAK